MSRLDELRAEYAALAHAMQTGVAMDQHYKPETLKHARVGINVALVDHGALVKLLLDKGVFTEEEYFEAAVEGMRREVLRYQELVRHHTGNSGDVVLM